MQGTQSSIVPDMTERRSQASRQRANEAALTAMDTEEVESGRPAWLRRWTSEEQRPTVVEGGGMASPEIRKEEAGALKASAGPVNAYLGQSIEAAFAYETVFHFETELEAESTEDWLNLSTEVSSEDDGETSLRLSGEVEEASLMIDTPNSGTNPLGNTPAETATIGQVDGDLAGREDGVITAAGLRASTSIDPKAVRAAIFRLAQESSSRWQPGEKQAAGTQGAAFSPLNPEGLASHGGGVSDPLFPCAQAEFAEVAQQVWTRDSTVVDGPFNQEEGRNQTAEPEGAAQTKPAAVVSFLHEAKPGEPESYPASPLDAARLEGDVNSPTTAVRDLHPGCTQEQIFSLPVQTAGQPIDEEGMTAGGAPALAHDAGNLLSALKLYSELLALSGVLQARHSHYAEDLKLLAARSEVLIHRLLQSFKIQEHESRIARAQELFPKTSESIVRSETQATQGKDPHSVESYSAERTGRADQTPALSSSARMTESPESGRSQLEESETAQQKVRYWTDDRLGATHGFNREALRGGREDSGDPPLTAKTVWVKAVPTASPRPAVVGTENEPDPGGGMQLDETVKAATASVVRSGDSGDSINFVELLTRWGGLLSMIARGPVQVNFGPHASLPVQVGEEALERILVNLVHNAMEATRDGGSVRIGVGRPETRRLTLLAPAPDDARPTSKMVLTVDDSGCGMTEQQVARVLGMDANTARQRSSSEAPLASSASVPRHRGHGMGLQIVRELVASSGGELAIYSRRGAGTRIEIQWPALTRPIENEELPQRIPPASTANISSNLKSQGSIQGPDRNLEGAIAC